MTYIEDNFIMKVFNDTTMSDSIFFNYESEKSKEFEFNDCFEKVFGDDSLSKKSTSIVQSRIDSCSSSSDKQNESKVQKRKKQLQKRQLKDFKKNLNKGNQLNFYIANKEMSKDERLEMINQEEKLINKMIEYVEKLIET